MFSLTSDRRGFCDFFALVTCPRCGVMCYVGAKVDANLKKQVEGANLRASVTRCRWEDASTAELRVGAACSFFTSTFFRLFSSFTPFCLSPTSAAGSDLVPNIELHDGKYIAIHSDLSQQE